MKNIPMVRQEAEDLIDLIDRHPSETAGTRLEDLAKEIRVSFGMITKDREYAQRINSKDSP